jgi:hypothetical protein
VVRFEDLLAAPVATLETVTDALGETCTDEMRIAIAERMAATTLPGRPVSRLARSYITRATAMERAGLGDPGDLDVRSAVAPIGTTDQAPARNVHGADAAASTEDVA